MAAALDGEEGNVGIRAKLGDISLRPSRRRAVIIGLGGIGSWLTQALAPMLAFDADVSWQLILIDADRYEERNRGRQAFTDYGDKALVQFDWVQSHFPEIAVVGDVAFVSAAAGLPVRGVPVVAASSLLEEGDVVLSAVDNHSTRLVLSLACQRLRDVTLISGGNELTDGNVQLYVRRRGRDVTPPIESYHPEIAAPLVKPPQEMSCEELSRSAPQLLATNLMCASIMLNMFYGECIADKGSGRARPEVYFDVLENVASPRA